MFLIYPKSNSELIEYEYQYEKDMNGLNLKILFFDLSASDNSSFFNSFRQKQQLVEDAG